MCGLLLVITVLFGLSEFYRLEPTSSCLRVELVVTAEPTFAFLSTRSTVKHFIDSIHLPRSAKHTCAQIGWHFIYWDFLQLA
ncbi:hypothetical protein RB195_000671 [Necator americanus]|uniref:Secreted protein n=1 Tax=Necator americanus TaxID=51031 RepID=A0ABR1DCK2_NECAM